MPDIVGVRLDATSQLVFCHGDGQAPSGRRVRVQTSEGERMGTVAIASQQIIAAPPLAAAPRVIGVAEAAVSVLANAAPPDVVFLPADDAAIGHADLARALYLAALPLAEQPPERRR